MDIIALLNKEKGRKEMNERTFGGFTSIQTDPESGFSRWIQ